MDDKKFHCSVCFKAFRIETAAHLHIKQAHGGQGAVGAGPGPGPSAAPVPVAPVMASAPILGANADDEEYRPIRRNRPTPQPLNKSILEMPAGAMEAMMAVWDKIGSSRLQQFLPSTAIAKVFAARPVDEATAAPTYQSVMAPTEPNPFEVESDPVDTAQSVEVETSELVPTDRQWFARSLPNGKTPFRPGKAKNPFETAAEQALPGPQARINTASGVQPPQAALDGVQPAVTVPQYAASAAPATSPFGSESASQSLSPFAVAGQAASPFASAAQAPSPFSSAAQAQSPFASAAQARSPFASSAPASPFGSTASPFTSAAQASPFPQTGSPFGATQQAMTMTTPTSPFSTSPFSAMPTEKLEKCPKCDRTFTTQRALSNHAKAKHDLDLPSGPRGTSRGPSMELPPYVPSPVDMASTVPYGGLSSASTQVSWSEVELFPQALSFTNMEVVGVVTSVETGSIDHSGGSTETVQLSVSIDAEAEEELVIRVFGSLVDVMKSTVSEGSTIVASGMLRLNPQHDAISNKYFAAPALHVAAPCGSISVVA